MLDKGQFELGSGNDIAVTSLAIRRAEIIGTCELVESQLTALQLDQTTFRRFADAVGRSPETAATHFPQSVATWYAQSVLIRLRRIGDRDKNSHSLHALLTRMKSTPGDWTLQAIVDLRDDGKHLHGPETLRSLAKSTYHFVSDASNTHLNIDRIIADIQRLDESLQTVKHLVDRTVAHVDRRGANDLMMTFEDIGSAIDKCEKIALPYISLLTGRSYDTLMPVDRTEWWKIFDGLK